MRNNVSKLSRFTGGYYFFLLLLILILARMAAVIPGFPRGGLDPSWIYGLSVATSSHLVFGRDIIYTFGPLSAVYTGFWSLEGHALSVILSVAAAFSLCFFTYKFFEKSEYIVKFLLIIFFFVNVGSHPDFFFTILPVIGSLLLIDSYSKDKCGLAPVGLFGFNAALLLLVKMSFGAESVLLMALLLVFYSIKKDWNRCCCLSISFCVSFIFLYAASGQKLSDIFYYPLSIYYGIAGYNNGMAYPGAAAPVITSAIFLLSFLIYFFYRWLKTSSLSAMLTAGILSLSSLVIFKQSFIRHDQGHSAEIYLYECFLLIYLLHVCRKSSVKNCLITLGVIALLVLMTQNYRYYFSGTQVKNAAAYLTSRLQNSRGVFNETRNKIEFDRYANRISTASPLPTLEGTSDIYGYNQAVLLASGNTWNPRPAFQSFQAVTPYLAKANYEHLLKKDIAPDNIFFRLETIDGRFQSMDDGLSWKALLGLYKPYGWTGKKDYLILKRDISSDKALSVEKSENLEGKMGEEITNPYPDGLVFIKLNIRKSLPGVILSVVYKTDPVFLRIKLDNGQWRSGRIIPSMSETGFLLSPFVTSTKDFSKLYEAGYFAGSSSGNGVRSIIVAPRSPYQYSDYFDVTFEQLEYPDRAKVVVPKLSKIRIDANAANDPSVLFNVDGFTYRFSNDRKLILGFRGWAFVNGTDIQVSSYSLIFAGQDGSGFEIPLVGGIRQDVSKYFNDGHNYDHSGYSADGLFDASEMNRNTEYKLYLRMKINGTEHMVPLNKSMTSSD